MTCEQGAKEGMSRADIWGKFSKQREQQVQSPCSLPGIPRDSRTAMVMGQRVRGGGVLEEEAERDPVCFECFCSDSVKWEERLTRDVYRSEFSL